MVCSVRYRVCRCPSALGGPIPPQLLHCNYGDDVVESYGHHSSDGRDSGSSNKSSIISCNGGGSTSTSCSGNSISGSGIDYTKDKQCYYVIAETNGYSID